MKDTKSFRLRRKVCASARKKSQLHNNYVVTTQEIEYDDDGADFGQDDEQQVDQNRRDDGANTNDEDGIDYGDRDLPESIPDDTNDNMSVGSGGTELSFSENEDESNKDAPDDEHIVKVSLKEYSPPITITKVYIEVRTKS